jgi:hypothetical protein
LHLRITRKHARDPLYALADRFDVGFPGQLHPVAESRDLLNGVEVFRAHDAILH